MPLRDFQTGCGNDEMNSQSGEATKGPTRSGLWVRLCRAFRSNIIEPLVLSRNTPEYDARGVALGLVIGFVVPVGGQLLSLGLLRIVIRFNYLAAAGFSLVSNPLNMIPLYYGYYCMGSVILGKPVAICFDRFEKLMHPVMDKTYFWEAFYAFAELGREILVRWLVAAVILAVVFGIAGYIATLWVQRKRCRQAAEKLGMEYRTFVEQLEKETGGKR